jgi:hypothetical protein
MFTVCSSSKSWFSSGCASAANIFYRHIDVFGTKTVPLNRTNDGTFSIIKILIKFKVNIYISHRVRLGVIALTAFLLLS